MTPKPANSTLEIQAPAVLSELRAAVARVLSGCGTPIKKPRHVQAALGIHQTLAWKIHRVALGPDLLSDGQFIPGRPGFTTFLDAARRRGVPAADLARASAAFDDYRSLIELVAGDRPSLEMMLQGMRPVARASAAEGRLARRPGFRTASSIWGVQMRMRLLCEFLHPSAEPGRLDIALVRGSIGMRRIRPDAVLPIGPVVLVDNDGECRQPGRVEAIIPEDVTDGAALLRSFCSQPVPVPRIGRSPRGLPEHQLGESPLGGTEGMTVYFGEVHRSAASLWSDDHNAFSNTALTVRQPTETAVIDIWVHRGVFDNNQPRTLYFGELSGVPWYEQAPGHAERITMAEETQTLGAGLNAAPLPDVPEYPALVKEMFDRLGWNPDAFTLHRLRVDYPAVATAMVVQFDMPSKPKKVK